MTEPSIPAAPKGATGILVLADGTIVWGRGFGATGSAVGEVCFNTAMTGYQEVMTDPSYAGQIVTFTFPHIGMRWAALSVRTSRRPAISAMTSRLTSGWPNKAALASAVWIRGL